MLPVCRPGVVCMMPNISDASGTNATTAFSPVGGQIVGDGATIQIGCDLGFIINGDPAMLTEDVSGDRT